MRAIELRNQGIAARKVPLPPGEDEMYEMQFVDRDNGDAYLIRFNKETRDALVRQLTGGIVLAGGEFPKLQ